MNGYTDLLNVYTDFFTDKILSTHPLANIIDCDELDNVSIMQIFRSKVFENDQLAKKIVVFSACTLPREILSQITFNLELVNFQIHQKDLLQWRPFSELMLIKEREAKCFKEINQDKKCLLQGKINLKKGGFRHKCNTDTSQAIFDLITAHIQHQPLNFKNFNVTYDGHLDENKILNLIHRAVWKNKKIFKGITLLSTCNFLPKELIQSIACKIDELFFFQTKENLLNVEEIDFGNLHSVPFNPFSDLLSFLKIRKQLSIETNESEKLKLTLQLRDPKQRLEQLYSKCVWIPGARPL